MEGEGDAGTDQVGVGGAKQDWRQSTKAGEMSVRRCERQGVSGSAPGDTANADI